MVINNTAIWVTKIIEKEGPGKWLIKGLAIDGDYGFGDEDTRSFEGRSVLISLSKRKIVDMRINTAHSTRIAGPLWFLKSVKAINDLLTPPFLITNLLDLDMHKTDSVDLSLSSEAQEIFNDDGPGNIYPICTSTAFGILEYSSTGEYGVTIFTQSKASDISFLKDETILFSEWDIPVGIVRNLS
jgi:hypothetical protein